MKAKIIMLEATEIAKFGEHCLCKKDNKIKFQRGEYFYKKLNFYLIDESAEIKKGDWFLGKNKPYQAVGAKELNPDFGKIIASTDKSLIIEEVDNRERNAEIDYRGSSCIDEELDIILPQLSEQSIKLLIDYYNQYGKMPDEVEVEVGIIGMTDGWVPSYNNPDNSGLHSAAEPIYGIKLNPQGTIDITIPEEITLTRTQAELMLSQFICEHAPHTSSKFNAGIYLNNWIDKNLK